MKNATKYLRLGAAGLLAAAALWCVAGCASMEERGSMSKTSRTTQQGAATQAQSQDNAARQEQGTPQAGGK